MSHDAARQLIEEALDEVRKGNYQQAIDLVERSIRLDPSQSEAYVLMGVSRSALGEREAATRAFQHAIELSPENARAFYNYAVHLYGAGDKATALEMAREAVRIDHNHGQAREMANRIERETGVEHLELPRPAPAPPSQEELSREMARQTGYVAGASTPYYRPPSYPAEYEVPVHSVAFIENLGRWWDGIGWAFCVLGIGCFIGSIFITIYTFGSIQEMMQGMLSGNVHQPTWVTMVSLFSLFTRLAIIIWMCLDISDRRSNCFWILPILVLCCFELSWLVQIIYILAGRPVRWGGPSPS